MKILIHAKNIELTPSIKTFAEAKVSSLSRFLASADNNLAEARVEIGKPSRHHKSGFVFYAEINLKIGKHLLRAAEEHLDIHTAIDLARDNVESQIKKQKQKGKEKRRLPKKVSQTE